MNIVHGLRFDNLRGDIYGGLTAAVVVLPLALAFGVASGAGPVAGLYGAIFVGIFAHIPEARRCPDCLSALSAALQDLNINPGQGLARPLHESAARMEVIVADITTLDVDAIVNAANESLLGGGGVDGAIHTAAGPGLLKECQKLGGCPTGEAKITGGYDLPASTVIHTVGPIWQGGGAGEDDLLAACYRRSLELALAEGLRTIAFPAISTGVYRFPPARASRIAVETVATFLASTRGIDRVIFCCFGEASAAHHDAALDELAPS
jgi:O-acetyl-ADP-ribose deacetylase